MALPHVFFNSGGLCWDFFKSRIIQQQQHTTLLCILCPCDLLWLIGIYIDQFNLMYSFIWPVRHFVTLSMISALLLKTWLTFTYSQFRFFEDKSNVRSGGSILNATIKQTICITSNCCVSATWCVALVHPCGNRKHCTGHSTSGRVSFYFMETARAAKCVPLSTAFLASFGHIVDLIPCKELFKFCQKSHYVACFCPVLLYQWDLQHQGLPKCLKCFHVHDLYAQSSTCALGSGNAFDKTSHPFTYQRRFVPPDMIQNCITDQRSTSDNIWCWRLKPTPASVSHSVPTGGARLKKKTSYIQYLKSTAKFPDPLLKR